MTHHHGYLYIVDPVTGQTTELVNHARTFQALRHAHLPQVRSLYEEGLCEAYYWVPDCTTETLDPASFGLPDASEWTGRLAAGISFPGTDGNYDVTDSTFALDLDGGITVRLHRSGDFIVGGSTATVVGQWGDGFTNVWDLNIVAGVGDMRFSWPDETAGSNRSMDLGNASDWDGYPWFVATLLPDNGSGEVEVWSWRSTDGVSWEEVENSTDSPAADMRTDAVPIVIGAAENDRAAEIDLVRVEVHEDTGPQPESPVVSRDYTDDSIDYTDPEGNEWQLQGSQWDWLYNPVEAPWYDPNIPQSAHALGFWIDEWTGLGSDHVRSSSTELGAVGRGATVGPRTPGPRTQSINLTLFGTNEEGLDHLFRWLEATLNSMHDAAALVDLLTRLTCPEDVDSWDGIVKQRKVAVVEGLHWIEQPLPRSGCVVRRANFVMAAQDPCMYVVRPELDVSTVSASWTREDLDELSFEACDPTVSQVFRAGLDGLMVELDVPFDRPAVGAAGAEVEIAFDANWFDDRFIFTAPLRVQVFALRGDATDFYESMPLLGQITFRGIRELEHISNLELRYDTVTRQVFERSSSFVGWQPGWRWVAPARGQPGPWWGSVTCHGFKVVVYPADVCTDWPLVPEFTVRARVGERISCP